MWVAAIGDNCLDAYVEQDTLAVGGNAANVAATFSRLGLESTYIGAVGDDAAAVIVREVMGRAVDHSHLHELQGRTGVTLVRLVNNDREFLHEDFGVGLSWNPDASVLDAVDGMHWVHVAGTGTDASVRDRLIQRGHRVSLDLSVESVPDSLTGTEVVFASWDPQSTTSPEERGRQILAAGASLAVVTSGSQGSLALTSTTSSSTPALPIEPVDTCGAGDSFIAGFIAAQLWGDDIGTALRAGTRAASDTCLHLGGFPQNPRPIPAWVFERYGNYLNHAPIRHLGNSR